MPRDTTKTGAHESSPPIRSGVSGVTVVFFMLLVGLFTTVILVFLNLDSRVKSLEKAPPESLFSAAPPKKESASEKRQDQPEVDFDTLLYGGKKPRPPQLSDHARQAAEAAVGKQGELVMPAGPPPMPPNVLSNYHFFEIGEPDDAELAERMGVRIPPDGGSIPDLLLDGLLHTSVCCRVDANTQTCPNTNQIDVVIRGVPDSGDHYLRVAVHNPAYFDVPCVFFWVSVNEQADGPPRLPN